MANKEKKKKGARLKAFFTDFKAFITKGNILDLAVAVVIGAAFGKIVTSLVNDVIMPLITLIGGGASVAELTITIHGWKGDAVIMYGNFLQTIIDFLIVAFFIFLALRVILTLQKQWDKLEKGIVELSKKERRQMVKRLKAEGLTRAEINVRIKDEEQKKSEELKAAQSAAEAAQKAETTDAILKDIRDLLAKSVGREENQNDSGAKAPDA